MRVLGKKNFAQGGQTLNSSINKVESDSVTKGSETSVVQGLLSLEVRSVALGYRALDALTRSRDLRVLDASPVGSRFLILLLGPIRDLEAGMQQVRAIFDGRDDNWIEDEALLVSPSQEILDGFFALTQAELKESLVVVDTATVSGVLCVLPTLLEQPEMKLIDFRVQRSSSGGAYAFITGPLSLARAAAEAARARLRETRRAGHIEVLEQPSEELRRFFHIEG